MELSTSRQLGTESARVAEPGRLRTQPQDPSPAFMLRLLDLGSTADIKMLASETGHPPPAPIHTYPSGIAGTAHLAQDRALTLGSLGR